MNEINYLQLCVYAVALWVKTKKGLWVAAKRSPKVFNGIVTSFIFIYSIRETLCEAKIELTDLTH